MADQQNDHEMNGEDFSQDVKACDDSQMNGAENGAGGGDSQNGNGENSSAGRDDDR